MTRGIWPVFRTVRGDLPRDLAGSEGSDRFLDFGVEANSIHILVAIAVCFSMYISMYALLYIYIYI